MMVKDREAWHAAAHGVTRVGPNRVTEQQYDNRCGSFFSPLLSGKYFGH